MWLNPQFPLKYKTYFLYSLHHLISNILQISLFVRIQEKELIYFNI